MTLKVALVLTGDASSAKRAVEETERAVESLNAENRQTAATAREVERAAREEAAALQAEAQAATTAAVAIEKANGARRGAAGVAIGGGAGVPKVVEELPARLALSNQQLGQMQFQLNDLAVQLASGASPFMAITQQGSQIAQSFAAGTGPIAAIRALGAGVVAFATNPLNLMVVGIAAASAAIPALWSAFSGPEADTAEESLASFRDYLKEIEGGYERAAESAKRFLEAATPRDVAIVRGQDARSGLAASLQAEIDALVAKSREAAAEIQQLFSGGGLFISAAGGNRVEDLRQLADELQRGIIGASEFRARLADIRLADNTPQAVRDVAAELQAAADAASELEANVRGADAALSQLTSGGSPSVPLDAALRDRMAASEGDTLAARLAEQAERIRAGAERDSARAGREAERAAREAEQAAAQQARNRQTVADLQAEVAALQLTGAERVRALAQLKDEQQIRAAIAGLGKQASAEDAAALAALIPARNAALEASKAQEAQLRAETQAAQTLGSAVGSALGAFAQGGDVARQALVRLGLQMAQLILQQQLLGSFGNGMGGLNPTGSFISAALGAVFGGFRAGGGRVVPGAAYVVGEDRPEVFVPDAPGTILPSVSAVSGQQQTARSELRVELAPGLVGAILRRAAGQSAQIVQGAAPTIAQSGAALARDDYARQRWGTA